jgi:superfamily II DNA/RNA helicase
MLQSTSSLSWIGVTCSLFICHQIDVSSTNGANLMHYNYTQRQRARTAQSGRGNAFSSSRPHSFKRNNGGANIPVERFINKSVVTVEAEAYQSQHTFADFKFDERINNNLQARGYVTPTPIQDQSLATVMQGKDLIGLANTGTGKTAAFLLPILQAKLNRQPGKAIIIVPTRELATQILDEFHIFAAGTPISATVCVGGANINRQIQALRKNPQIIIGTPGRLKDLFNQRKLPLFECRTLVLDEVDRMLDMGFIHDIRFLVEKLPTDRQSLCFSATMTKDIEALAHTFLKQPVTVSVRTRPTSDNVNQDVVYIQHKDEKVAKLQSLLNQPEFTKVLVFGGTKWGVEKLAIHLQKSGLKVATIHGNKSQPQRQRALNDFKSDKVQALIATDVAARGIDIPNVSHVINYDIPQTYEEYIHRIGRTGRANQTGQALTFVPVSAKPPYA